MKIICFLPYSEIDWGTTWTAIGTIASVLLTVVIFVIQTKQSKRINEIESKNIEKEHRIALFDKRYEIYDLFTRFYKTTKNILQKVQEIYEDKDSEFDVENIRDCFKTRICLDFSNYDGIIAKLEYESFKEKTNDDGNDESIDLHEYKANEIKRDELGKMNELINKKFMNDSLTKLGMAKFCFSKDVSVPIINFSKAIFKDILEESNSNDWDRAENENHYFAEKFFNNLYKSLDEIKSKNIIQKMEQEIG